MCLPHDIHTIDATMVMDMANPLVALEKQLKAKRKERDQLDKTIREIEALLAQARALNESLSDADNPTSDPTGGGGPVGGAKRSREGARPAEIVQQSKMILEEQGRPMTRGQLLEGLLNRGIEVGGANPANKVGTTISRNLDVFVHLEGFGYWLRSVPYSPAQYIPETGGKELSGEASSVAVH